MSEQNQNLIPPQEKPKRNYDKSVHGHRLGIPNKIAVMALKDTGQSARSVADQVGVHSSTIIRCWQDPELKDLLPDVVRQTKVGLGGLFYKRGLQATLRIDKEKLDQASALQLATVAGIMVDKGRLMEGLSTENVSLHSVVDSADADRKQIMARLQAMDLEP